MGCWHVWSLLGPAAPLRSPGPALIKGRKTDESTPNRPSHPAGSGGQKARVLGAHEAKAL